MKIETWYDICCDKCGKHISTDYGIGMIQSKKELKLIAKEKGWKYLKINNKNYCFECVNKYKI